MYTSHFYVGPTCFDNFQNADERGIDCGGACTRLCAFDVKAPVVKWSRSFKVVDGQYNAVAYIENQNQIAATPEINYTFTLYDADGLITERRGKTILPPDSVYPIFEGRINTGERIPTKTFIELEAPEIWLPAEEGRGQFTVVDRNLKAADTNPRLETVIENNALTEAKEVEVVATIFDARGNALTSSRTFVDQFAARERRAVVFTWPEPITKTLRSCEVPTDVVIAIDLSGSMNNDNDNPPEPIQSVLTAAQAFVSRLQTNDKVGVVTFATGANLNQPLTTDKSTASSLIAGLTIDPKEETGNTNTGDALKEVGNELRSERHNQSARKVAVLLTDGLATAPEVDPETYALDQALALRGEGIEVYTIGLGQQVNMDFVRALATAPEYAFQALSTQDVNKIYQEITGAICEDGAAIIDIVPKTNASFAPLR